MKDVRTVNVLVSSSDGGTDLDEFREEISNAIEVSRDILPDDVSRELVSRMMSETPLPICKTSPPQPGNLYRKLPM